MQRVHFQVRVGVFNVDKDFFRYLFLLWEKTNRMWFSVGCTLIDNDTRHHSCASRVDNILASLMTRIVDDKSTDNAKPRSIC